jgi:hypothetical protein
MPIVIKAVPGPQSGIGYRDFQKHQSVLRVRVTGRNVTFWRLFKRLFGKRRAEA